MARFLQTPLKMLPRQIFSRRNRFPPLQRKVKTLLSSTEEPGCGNVFQVGHCHRLQSPLGLSVKMEYVHALLEGFLGFQ